jgi:hypothetical protein
MLAARVVTRVNWLAPAMERSISTPVSELELSFHLSVMLLVVPAMVMRFVGAAGGTPSLVVMPTEGE